MGGPVFDRQVFVKKQQSKPPRSRSPIPGGLVLLLVAGLSALATYRYVKAGGSAPHNPADKAQIEQLQKKLKATQARLDELEKRRHARPVRHIAEDVKPEQAKPAATKPNHAQLAEAASHPAARTAADLKHATNRTASFAHHSVAEAKTSDAPRKVISSPSQPSVAKGKTPVTNNPSPSNKQLSTLQNNISASHEEWQATANRLGNVVGELNSQQSAIQKNQNGVNYLLERVQRSDVSFTLRKGSGLRRVGPISMELASTSVKGQHYSIRMIVDDKSVELKDRALNEIVQFYTSRSKYPLRLIVSEIKRGEVSGTLAVPSALNQESASHQLQQR